MSQLRGLWLLKNFPLWLAAAVDSEGNVYQWGAGYAGSGPGIPEKTLSGQSVVQIACGSKASYVLTAQVPFSPFSHLLAFGSKFVLFEFQ